MDAGLRSYRFSKAELAVFVSGIVSMGLEILAVRVVAPQFGSHIYTIGGILTVFLAALSLGYWRGGKRAAAHASTDRLVWLFLLTAVYVAVLIFARDLLLVATATIPLPARYASLPAVILLFGPPTYFLGFVSPYAAQLSQKADVGAASGHVYALGTIGSIIGSAGTTFLLIPTLSIDGVSLLFGLLLVSTALVLTVPSLPRVPVASIAVVTLLLFAAAGSGSMGYSVHGEVVHQSQTPYQELEVIDRGSERTMFLDGTRHSAKDLEDPDRHVFAYTAYFHLPYLTVDDPDEIDRALFVGGGGYTGPQSFVERDENVHVDVVEIDPEVTAAAKEYFGLEESERLEAHTGDGRQFLEESDETYDVIVLDAYKQDNVPFHLTTREFMELAKERLSDDGVLVANVISAPSGPASEFYRAEYRTMEAVFPQVYSFRTSDTGAVQNIQLVATKDDERLSQETLQERNAEREIGIDLETAVGYYEGDVDTTGAPVLEDDNAPVDSLLDPMVGQRYVIEETDGGNESETARLAEPPSARA
ncbi:spermidine synthase [Natrononativus amylolyticus]|uniref:spermidine synthase n=1 Tax=Natrononativus amylolyticus TaxID=2963434 RepID=UPI0020CDACE9|nr:fused MFS/spermidine synthase [Natrononativus amylolyticus]